MGAELQTEFLDTLFEDREGSNAYFDRVDASRALEARLIALRVCQEQASVSVSVVTL